MFRQNPSDRHLGYSSSADRNALKTNQDCSFAELTDCLSN